MVEDVFQGVLAENQEVFILLVRNTLGTHLQLVGALLTTDVEYAPVCQLEHGLQREGRLANARLAAQQHNAAGHQSAAKYPVQLAVVHVDARVVVGGNLFQPQHLVLCKQRVARILSQLVACRCSSRRGCNLFARVGHLDFLEGVPLSAGRTLAYPFR